MFGAPEYTSEKIGRNKDALVKRKREDAEAEEQFLRLLGRAAGKTQGGKNLVEAMKREEEERVKNGGQPLPVKKAKKGEGDEDGEGERGEEGDGKRKRRNKGFSAEAIKRIGFDPTMPIGVVRRDERDEKKRVSRLDVSPSSHASFADCYLSLSAHAGRRSRSPLRPSFHLQAFISPTSPRSRPWPKTSLLRHCPSLLELATRSQPRLGLGR